MKRFTYRLSSEMADWTAAMDTKTDQAPLPEYILEAALDVWGQAGRQHLIPITGRSMLPFIQDGDRVRVSYGYADVGRGDVIVFRQGGRLIAQRVLRVCSGEARPTFITKGDNARHFDPPVSAEEIVGRVLSIKRGDRNMSLDTVTWRLLGWLIAVGTLAWAKLYGWSRAVKQRLLGPQPNRLTSFLRRGALAFFSLALRVVQVGLCRWEG
jgi:signal peptidase I